MIRTLLFLLFLIPVAAPAQEALKEREYIHTLTSADGHGGGFVWKMKRADRGRRTLRGGLLGRTPDRRVAAGGGPGNGAQLAGSRRRLPRTLLRAEQQTGKEPHSRPLPRGTRFLHLLVPDGIPARPEGVRRQKGLAPGRRHQLPCGDLAQRQHGGQHGRHVPAARHRHHRQGHLRPGERPGREGLSRGHARARSAPRAASRSAQTANSRTAATARSAATSPS